MLYCVRLARYKEQFKIDRRLRIYNDVRSCPMQIGRAHLEFIYIAPVAKYIVRPISRDDDAEE